MGGIDDGVEKKGHTVHDNQRRGRGTTLPTAKRKKWGDSPNGRKTVTAKGRRWKDLVD